MGCIIPVDSSTRITEISSTINCKIILSDVHSPFSNFMNINCVGIRTRVSNRTRTGPEPDP